MRIIIGFLIVFYRVGNLDLPGNLANSYVKVDDNFAKYSDNQKTIELKDDNIAKFRWI